MQTADPETKLQFPKDFLIGSASSAHQVEGGNIHSDWWNWEQKGWLPKSGDAADHYNRFEEDFKLARDIGLNAMRISIEWARIEPFEGKWNADAIEHYKKVLRFMKEQGLTRMVTLWHWTLPKWLADKGGFESPEGVEAFARYSWFIAQNLGLEIDLWVTLNEPETFCQQAYSFGRYPPFKKSRMSYLRVLKNLIEAHKKSYLAIKQAFPEAKIGMAKNFSFYKAQRPRNFLDQLIVFFADRIGNHYFLEKLHKYLDFVGVNYYFFNSVRFDYRHGYKEMNNNFSQGQLDLQNQARRSDMGWLLFPEGIYHLLLGLKKFGKPIYITENGLADAADSRRPEFLRETLAWVSRAITDGANVKGYFHWALTDNFEWTQGFWPRFGLIAVDFTTQKRTIRPSAGIIKQIELR